MLSPYIFAGLDVVIQNRYANTNLYVREGVNKERILFAINNAIAVSPEELLSKSRKGRLVDPRTMFIFMMYATGRYSQKQVGKMAGGLDHSTVIYHIKRHKDLMQVDKNYQRLVEKINNYL